MAQIAIRVLMLNRQLNPAITLKQALESTGQFDVTTFTSPEAAFDFLRGRPQDIALLDFTLSGITGLDLVLRTRSIQPDIAIIATPARADVQEIVRDLRLNGMVEFPIHARRLIPVLKDAVAQLRETLPDTAEAPAYDSDSDTLTIAPPPDDPQEREPDFSSLDSVLVNIGGLDSGGTETLDVDMSDAAYADNANTQPQTVEFILTGNFEEMRRNVQGPRLERPKQGEADDAVGIFQQLAAEEPPMPTLEESGTVGDLMIGVGDTDLQEVVRLLRQSQVNPRRTAPEPHVEDDETPVEDSQPLPPPPSMPEQPPDVPELDDEMGENTARIILQTALDDSASMEFSLDELLGNIDRQLPEGKRGVKPLPSWKASSERYVREPDFLEGQSDEALDAESIPPVQSHLQTTDFGVKDDSEQVEARPAPPPPPMDLPEEVPTVTESQPEPQPLDDDQPETGPLPVSEEPEYETGFGLQVVEDEPDVFPDDAVDDDYTPDGDVEDDAAEDEQDSYFARLALSLTQASLDLNAEATLLARGGKIIATAGDLPREDIKELEMANNGAWEADVSQTRIRFITMPNTGKDFMICARGTEDGYTLVMIFAGNVQVGVINRQTEQLIDALSAVPEAPAPPEEDTYDDDVEDLQQELDTLEREITSQMQAVPPQPEPAAEAGPLRPYTFLWLVRDMDYALPDEMAQAIVAGLDVQLTREGWQVDFINIYEDYVYMMVGVPGETSPHDVINDLKRRSAEMAFGSDERINPETLWLDSYYSCAPGRELSVEEIQRYINFARAR